MLALFSGLAPVRKREVSSAVAHYIAGVLDRESMVEIVEGLCAAAELQAGDRVKTLRGTARGVVVRILDDDSRGHEGVRGLEHARLLDR